MLHEAAMPQSMPQIAQLLLVGFCILGGLLLLALIRIFLLWRSNRRMVLACAKMEKQTAAQQVEIIAIHHDSNSWRAKTLRQFDALRSDFTHRLVQAEQAGHHALQHLKDSRQGEIAQALAKIAALEAKLAAKPAATALQKAAIPVNAPQSVLPSLPAMETLRLRALEAELATARTELAASRQQAAGLQRALLLARRRQPALRKNSVRGAARGA